MNLNLASQSPRRRQLLAVLGLPFDVQSTAVDEQRHPDEAAADYVRRLSREKAQAAAQTAKGRRLIAAADTIVVDGDDVLEKPRDAAHARAILQRLRARTHEVFTAVTLLDTDTRQTATEMARSPVTMRDYSDAEIETYIASGDPFDKAGAYAIQHEGFDPVEGFGHCFANVMGLPLCHLTRMLRQFEVVPPVDVPARCQQAIDYDCPVYAHILAGGE